MDRPGYGALTLDIFFQKCDVVRRLLPAKGSIDVVSRRLFLGKDGVWRGPSSAQGYTIQGDDVSALVTEFVFATSGLNITGLEVPSEKGTAILGRLNEYLQECIERQMRNLAAGC